MAAEKTEIRTFVVRNQLGMHARPASMFVKASNRFEAGITVQKNGNVINGKSIMGLMMLAAEAGASLVVSATGSDAVEALDALEKLFEERFGED